MHPITKSAAMRPVALMEGVISETTLASWISRTMIAAVSRFFAVLLVRCGTAARTGAAGECVIRAVGGSAPPGGFAARTVAAETRPGALSCRGWAASVGALANERPLFWKGA